MTAMELIARQQRYLLDCQTYTGLAIRLFVSSAGAIFTIVKPSTGEQLHRTRPIAARTFQEFQRAVDGALVNAVSE